MPDIKASRRIIGEIGEADKLYGFELHELKWVVLPAGLIGFILLISLPFMFGILAFTFCLLIAFIIINITPDRKSASTWLKERWTFLRRPKVLSNLESDKVRGKKFGLPELKIWHDTSQGVQTQEITGFKRFYEDHNAAQRTDGSIYGAIRVEPANMSLADQDEWEKAVSEYSSVINNCDFDFQTYSTMKPYDPSDRIEQYRRRLKDPDVRGNEQLRKLINTYINVLPSKFKTTGASIQQHYILTHVSDLDVQMDRHDSVRRLEHIPVLGWLSKQILSKGKQTTEEELKERKLEVLDKRLNKLSAGMRGVNGCRARRATTSEIAAILKSHWESKDADPESLEESIRTSPVVYNEDMVKKGGEQR